MDNLLPKAEFKTPVVELAIGFGLLLAIGQYIKHQQKPPPTCDGSISGSICTRVGL